MLSDRTIGLLEDIGPNIDLAESFFAGLTIEQFVLDTLRGLRGDALT